MPSPTSLPVSVPNELKIGKVEADGAWVRLSPEQASKLAAQLEYYQTLCQKAYILGRSEGVVALKAEQELSESRARGLRKVFMYSVASSFIVGAFLSVGLLYWKDTTDVK